jgi:benzoyl-CoA reductase subunit C
MKRAATAHALPRLSAIAATLENDEVREWKGQGGRVMGYLCSTIPEEMFTAAGLLPFRLRGTGSTSTEKADVFFSSINCSFPRHCLNQVLGGECAFLDGLVLGNSCDNVRRIYDHWVRLKITPFVHFMSLPRRPEEAQVAWYYNELLMLKTSMEKHFGAEITADRLREAIWVHNESRRLQRELYEMRKAKAPRLTGAQTLAVTVAGTAMPRPRFNDCLKALLEELRDAPGNSGHRARLMLVGGILDDPAYLEVIEERGGLIVADSTCFGSRLFWRDVDEEAEDPLRALARHYVAERPSCPRVFDAYESRTAFIRKMIDDFAVDGVILERLMFCDSWGWEQYRLHRTFKEWGVPLLMLDREYTMGGQGQLRTRVQAFLETMGR